MKGAVKNYVYGGSWDNYTENPNIPNDYLIYARFNGNFRDRSVNQNHFQLYPGTSTVSFAEGRKPRTRSVKFNYFSAQDSIITTNNVVYGANIVSVSMWVNIEEIGGAKFLATSNDAYANPSQWFVALGLSESTGSANYDKVMVGYKTATNTLNAHRNEEPPYLNQWLHIVVIINKAANTRKLYINNINVGLTASNSNVDTSNFADGILRLGVKIKGRMQDLRVYNRELTFSERTNLYNE